MTDHGRRLENGTRYTFRRFGAMNVLITVGAYKSRSFGHASVAILVERFWAWMTVPVEEKESISSFDRGSKSLRSGGVETLSERHHLGIHNEHLFTK